MASAVVRVKRRLDDEPLEALVVNCKKRKINPENKDEDAKSEEISSTVLKFAGTIKEVSVYTHNLNCSINFITFRKIVYCLI